MISHRAWRGLDRPLLWATVLLLLIGLVALYSASYQRALATGTNFLGKQLVWLGLGLVVAVGLMAVDYHRWLEGAYLLYGLNLVLLGLVLVVGETRGGAQRWLAAGPITFQPSELAKLSTILVLARYLGGHREAFHRWRSLIPPGLIILFPMALILKEPNLGTALLFIPIALSMLFVWGIPVRMLWTLAGGIAAAIPLGWHVLHEYQRARLLVFVNPNLDPLGAGYTVLQSKIAVGSGLLWGRGWLAGTQNQLNFLPERHTDFIFSVIGEEWGFLGAGVVLLLYGWQLHRGIAIAAQSRDPFARLLVAGLTTMLGCHVVINVGMTLGLMPVVGLPLPFVSYGGSWLLTCLAAIGMILSVAMRRPGFG